MVLWKCWLAVWRCGGSSAQLCPFLWAALNNVVCWLFHAKKLKNISRNLIGEKGLWAQISGSRYTHFWKHCIFFELPVKYSGHFSFFSSYFRKWLGNDISKHLILSQSCPQNWVNGISLWDALSTLDIFWLYCILFTYTTFLVNRISHQWGLGAYKDGMKYLRLGLLNWQNDSHHPDG